MDYSLVLQIAVPGIVLLYSGSEPHIAEKDTGHLYFPEYTPLYPGLSEPWAKRYNFYCEFFKYYSGKDFVLERSCLL